MEALDGRGQGCVDETVLFRVRQRDEQPDCLVDLVAPQHVVVVEAAPGVPEQVRVGRWGDGHAVPGLEGLHDLIGLVADPASAASPN